MFPEFGKHFMDGLILVIGVILFVCLGIMFTSIPPLKKYKFSVKLAILGGFYSIGLLGGGGIIFLVAVYYIGRFADWIISFIK